MSTCQVSEYAERCRSILGGSRVYMCKGTSMPRIHVEKTWAQGVSGAKSKSTSPQVQKDCRAVCYCSPMVLLLDLLAVRQQCSVRVKLSMDCPEANGCCCTSVLGSVRLGHGNSMYYLGMQWKNVLARHGNAILCLEPWSGLD